MAFDSDLTAWSTLALAVLAVVTAIFAYFAWRGQRSELTILKTQLDRQAVELAEARSERDREARERREVHVNRVYVWDSFQNIDVSPDGTGTKYASVKAVELRNTGEQPIYDITFAWYVKGQLAHQQRWARPLLPKEDPLATWWEVPEELLPSTDITVAAFIRDANGNGWRIRPDGRHEPVGPQGWPPGDGNDG